MIISRTPFRVSFFGGGTDYPAWYLEHGGKVLATAIDKYCYISCRYLPPFFEHKYRIVYSKIENVKHYNELRHPAVRAVLSYLECEKGLEIHHDGDLPARSGLGSSSAFTVGLLNVLYALQGKYCSSMQLAKEAIHIEQDIIQEHVGSQDQISTSLGGFNRIEFFTDGRFEITPLIIPNERKSELQKYLMLFFTGISRFASEVAKSQIENLKKRSSELYALGGMVDEAIKILSSKEIPIEEFGQLLHESWQYKRKLSEKITNKVIDDIYNTARLSGAMGGKIIGAGGGGFILLFVPPEQQEKVKKALEKLIYVPFNFENTGSRIVFYHPED
ncbi:MAG: kinase [Candidatus Parabeggiatoa sp. nov. 2]|nr:MAG: kinase [Beggiatoa sp. 4572_84]